MKRSIIAAFALALVAALFSIGSAQAQCVDIAIGDVCADGDPLSQTGDIYADGNSDNPEPLDGYAGVNDEEGVVACAEGDYDTDHRNPASGGNNTVSEIPPAVPEGPPSTGGPCSPKGP